MAKLFVHHMNLVPVVALVIVCVACTDAALSQPGKFNRRGVVDANQIVLPKARIDYKTVVQRVTEAMTTKHQNARTVHVKREEQYSVQTCRKAGSLEEMLECLFDLMEQQERRISALEANKVSSFGNMLFTMNLTSPSFVNVVDFGAVGDAITDNTDAFQRALDTVGNAGGGIVFVPRGLYLFKGSLIVPNATFLQGIFLSVPSHPGLVFPGTLDPNDGTILLPTANAGIGADGEPFITVFADGGVRGLVIYYPYVPQYGEPVPYPYSISLVGCNAAVEDVELLNSFNGILAVGAHRHLIRNVHGQPINSGLYVDDTTDIGRIENVHFNPWFSGMSSPIFTYQRNSGIAFSFYRTDWEYVLNTFAFGYNVGYFFGESQYGSMNGNLVGIGCDYALRASVLVNQSDPWGLLITNGEFTAFGGDNSTQVEVTENNRGEVRFTNSAFWGPSWKIANLHGAGPIGFTSCIFSAWDFNNEGAPAIDAHEGSLVVSGCDFQQSGFAPQIRLGKEIIQAVIIGNLISAPQNIQDHSTTGSVQIALNAVY